MAMFRISFHILLFISLMIVFSCVEFPDKNSIYGTWEGEHSGKYLLFKFKNDQKCILSFEDKASGKVESINGRFDTDFTKNPIALSIKKISQLNHPLHTIIEFTGNDEIRIAGFGKRWRFRPITFDSNTSMVLRRVEEKI